jgi:trk system potassium uptake protein TrkH
MNFSLVFKTISILIAIEGVAICLSSGVASVMGDPEFDILCLLACGGITIAAGLIGYYITCKASGQLAPREGIAVVTFGWLLISIFGALPFFVGVGMKWYDAFFETVSGFTTTGATVISKDLELYPGYVLPDGIQSLRKGILFWRALTHWIGGMGIVVFFLVILPMLVKGGQALYNAEVPGVKTRSDQFTPRITSTAKILLLVYCLLTLAETILLFFSGMSLFDAVCHSFATISTGGFSTRNDSIAGCSANIQLIIIIFMFLAGCNFILHFRVLTGLPLKDYLNEEFRTFFLILLGASIIIAGYLFFSDPDPDLIKKGIGNPYQHDIKDSLLAAVFQVVSISTTTGFSTGNYAVWPKAAGMIIFCLMLMGGCGGSTSGGIKCMRVILLWKFSLSELRRKIFPHSLQNIRLNGDRMSVSTINQVLGFLMIYMLTALVFQLLFTFVCKDMDLLEAISASVTCISNVGPGFGKLGPDQSFYWVSAPAKLLMALEMLIGRLELYTVMIFFLPSFWKK